LDNATCTIVPPNDPPVKPSTPSGKASGAAGTEYTYTSSTTDPDGDALFYLWDWGDGTDLGHLAMGKQLVQVILGMNRVIMRSK